MLPVDIYRFHIDIIQSLGLELEIISSHSRIITPVYARRQIIIGHRNGLRITHVEII